MNTEIAFEGEKYKAASARQKEWGAKLIAELKLQGAEQVLDLGCDDGYLTAQLAKLMPQGCIVGIDSSQSMIDVARRLYEKLGFQRSEDLDFMQESLLVFGFRLQLE